MKNLNEISWITRDELLVQNIGKYNQIEQRLIYPIGEYFDIYNYIPIKNKSITPNGLLDYVNNNYKISPKGEFSEDLYFPNSFIRGKESVDLGYGNHNENKYSNYNDSFTYNDPKDKNWWTLGADAAIGFIMGDNVGISSSNGQFSVSSTSTDIPTSILGGISNALISNSNLSKFGLKGLGYQFTNSFTNKLRTEKSSEDFLNKPLEFYNKIDELEHDLFKNIPSNTFFNSLIPIYNYTKIKEDKESNLLLTEGFTWNNGVNDFDFEKNSLLNKTKQMFNSGKIQTLITKTGDGKVYKGNKYRSWTIKNKYDKLSNLIRPFNKQNYNNLNKTLELVRPGIGSLEKYGVLDNTNGFVKISPYSDNGNDVKKYMFSIENLAWKDNIDEIIEGTSQEGPNGGRIMWFPPYDISFNETTSVNITKDVFIGRGEPVYTYVDTERSGTLSFKVIVDHPSVINYYSEQSSTEDDDYLKFFNGKNVKNFDRSVDLEKMIKIAVNVNTTSSSITKTFKIYFPNNYSGVDDTDAIEYLLSGKNCSGNGGNGYEINNGLWSGLTESGETSPCFGRYYYYRVDSDDDLSNVNNYKDSISFGLNNSKSNTDYSFKDAFNGITGKTELYNFLTGATEIEIVGSSSSHGNEDKNKNLATNRINTVIKWLKNFNTKIACKQTIITSNDNLINEDVNTLKAKEQRYVLVKITSKGNSNNTSTNSGNTNNSEQTNESQTDTSMRVVKSMYGYHNDIKNKTLNDESKFFKQITENSIQEIISNNISKKIKYFHPAFHSTTPEGFNTRLTFLHQCTRQGPTMSSGDKKNSATNMSFGRPPVCILRIGDFYNTKVLFTNLNIDFEPLVWDLNQEGIGVQPMIANISINFQFIGGSDLTGPIARLQNAITFNFFANTGVYDDRNDRFNSKNEYDKLYNPNVKKK